MSIKPIVADTASGNQGRAPGLYDEQLQRQQQERLLFTQAAAEPRTPVAPADPVAERRRRALHF